MIASQEKPVLKKYPFTQIQTGIIAFVGNLQLKLQQVLPEMPVFIIQTGDQSYYFQKKFAHVGNAPKEIIQYVPRVVIKIEDFQIQTDQNSMQYNELKYHYKNQNYVCMGRRHNHLFTMSVQLVSSNFVKALQLLEIAQSITSHDNSGTYEYVGCSWEFSYAMVSASKEEPSLQVSSESRDYTIMMSTELLLPIWAIRIDTIRTFEEAGVNDDWLPNFNINIDNGDGTSVKDELIMTDEDYPEDDENNSGDDSGVIDGSAANRTETGDTSWIPTINVPDTFRKEMDGAESELFPLPKPPIEMPGDSTLDVHIPDKD